jgi:hypothetical protein
VLRTGVKGVFNPSRKKAEVFGHFGHRPMPHSVVVYAKFTLLFAKLPKMETPNAKLLDTSFCHFWQIIRMQTLNTKPLEMLQHP